MFVALTSFSYIWNSPPDCVFHVLYCFQICRLFAVLLVFMHLVELFRNFMRFVKLGNKYSVSKFFEPWYVFCCTLTHQVQIWRAGSEFQQNVFHQNFYNNFRMCLEWVSDFKCYLEGPTRILGKSFCCKNCVFGNAILHEVSGNIICFLVERVQRWKIKQYFQIEMFI